MLGGMSPPRLSHFSCLLRGLVAGMGPATPYELKQVVNASLGYFWSFPHSQLYSEPDRLAGLGLLEVEQEEAGRRAQPDPGPAARAGGPAAPPPGPGRQTAGN